KGPSISWGLFVCDFNRSRCRRLRRCGAVGIQRLGGHLKLLRRYRHFERSTWYQSLDLAAIAWERGSTGCYPRQPSLLVERRGCKGDDLDFLFVKKLGP